MRRRALLVGVSEYGEGFDPLPGSLLDVRRMAAVLKSPEQGAFEQLIALENPNLDEMVQAIEEFFRGTGKDKDDLLLLYFSGHGDLGSDFARQQLHLCARGTRQLKGRLMESSAMSAEFLKRQMDLSKSQQIIVILDCCYSGAIADLLRKGNEDNAFNELRAPGRVILASSSASQPSYQSTNGLSLYTHYLLEGMAGAAKPKDSQRSWICVQDLHAYAERRFEVEQKGGILPKIIVSRDKGYDIPIVKAPQPAPLLEYRQEVDELFQDLDRELGLDFNGKIEEPLVRARLEALRSRLRVITPEEAQQIEQEVQAPYVTREKRRRDYQRNFEIAVKDGFWPNEFYLKQLNKIRQDIGLGEEDADRIAQFVARQRRLRSRPAPMSSPSQIPRVHEFSNDWAETMGRAASNTTQLTNKVKSAAGQLSGKASRFQSQLFTRRAFLNSLRLAGIGFCVSYIYKNFDILAKQFSGINLSQNSIESRVFNKKKFEEKLHDGIKIEMIPIKTENFVVDSSSSYIEDDQGRKLKEIEMPDFFISCTEITQEQYKSLMGQNPSRFLGDSRPVETVSWDDAQRFCQLLSEKTGKRYRLPTEDEWEYACRAKTRTPFSFGETLTPDLANYRENESDLALFLSPSQTKNVGSFPPNEFRIFDMHGNVSEWCGDHLYVNNEKVIFRSSNSPANKDWYAARGGSYATFMEEASSSSRQTFHRHYSHETLGFRIVCSFQ